MSDEQVINQQVSAPIVEQQTTPPGDTSGHLSRAIREAELDKLLVENSVSRADVEVKQIWEQGLYPFQGEKLSRADLVYLLKDGRVEWKNEKSKPEKDRRWGLDLRGADLSGEDLSELELTRVRGGLGQEWDGLTVEQRDMSRLHLEGTVLTGTRLEGALLTGACLQGATLQGTLLEQAVLSSAHCEGAVLCDVNLSGARMRGVYFDPSCSLDTSYGRKGSQLSNRVDGAVLLGEVRWGGADLTRIDWKQLRKLGEELEARAKKKPYWQNPEWAQVRDLGRRALKSTTDRHTAKQDDSKEKESDTRVRAFQRAVAAYRQLATALRAQGLNEDADRFSERAQICQRKLLFRQILEDWRRPWRIPGDLVCWLFCWFLALLAGYGYHPGRTLMWYFAVIGGFAFAYFQATHGVLILGLHPSQVPPLQWYEALVLSVSAFHGRGFFQPVQSLGDPVAILAAAEAIIGLLIEISFIATFTQRFFGSK